jgi:hypothetical protein
MMAQGIASSAILYETQADVAPEMIAAFLPAVNSIRRILREAEGSDGKLSARRARDFNVLPRVGDVVMRLYVGEDGRSPYADDGFTPLAPFPRLLNRWMYRVTRGVVQAHSDYLNTVMPDDVKAMLRVQTTLRREATADSFQRRWGRRYGMFRSNPLAQYEPAHTWVDPNGYQLSRRVWNAGLDARRAIDDLVSIGIRRGVSSADLSDAVEVYLLPVERGRRTLRPYGSRFQPGGASFSGMRLARTEITHSHSQASLTAAQQNPYVTGIDWALSARHPRFDICDGFATIGMSGGRIRPPMPVRGARVPPAHPHCLCVSIPAVTATPEQVSDDIRRGLIEAGEVGYHPSPPPLYPEDFLLWLLGAWASQEARN